jgi:signal transduction histidine kinase
VELAESGLASAEDAAAALDDATAARQRLFQLLDTAPESDSSPLLAAFLQPVDAVISTLGAGDYEAAKSLVKVDMETIYIDLVDSLQTELDEAQAAMDAHEAAGTRFSDFVRFFLTLAIPAAAVLVYRTVAKRQVREHRMRADVEIQAERDVNKAKDAFIAGLSHELRTPLTSIYGFAEVMSDDKSGQTDSRELSKLIVNEAAEMTRMVDDLLTAARIDSTGVEIDLQPTRLADVVESAVAPFEKAGVSVQRISSQVVAETDAARLRHILVNLLSNAVQHGGQTIGVSISAGDRNADVEVWDDGPGVPDEHVEKLFDRFIHNGSTPLLTGSVGLGLAVASSLATKLGGRLSYQRFNTKSYFIVSLPLAEAEIPTPEPRERRALATLVKALTS